MKKTDYIRIDDLQNRTSEPADYTDVGQAQKFIEAYGDRVRFTPVTGWLVFDGQVWREDSIAAQSLSQSLTKLQLSEARKRLRVAHDMKDRAAEGNSEDEKKKAKELEEKEEAFRNFVLKRRKSANIAATLVESKPPLTVDVAELDANPYMLNTPAGEINLRTGEVTKHNPTSLCTKMTAVSPGTKGKDVFENFLRQICCDDTELMAYLQECAGMFAVGKVLREKMIIATGTGGNGKSTFFGLLLRVLGDYGGMIASDVLVTTRRNKSPELAELRGKRLVVAAELEEGMRLDSAMAKKIASRDRIRGEAKYRAPFDFWPSHSTVLFTNFLPKVGSNDGGTWSRLVVVPFNATFRGTKKEILDYDGVLFRECGEAVLQWIVDGAVTFLKNEGRIAQPACVVKAIAEYREQNDWLSNFLTECCERGTAYKERSSTLYERYRQWCESEGDFVRRKDEFRAAMEKAGFEYKKTMDGAFVRGVRAVNETLRDLRDNLNSEKNTAVPAWVG